MAVLGIDFGTSYTLVVRKDGDNISIIGKPDLYNYAAGSSVADFNPISTVKGIRTVIGYSKEGKWLIGNDVFNAIETGELTEKNTCFDIKTMLRDILEWFAKPENLRTIDEIPGNDLITKLRNMDPVASFGLFYIDKNNKKQFYNAIDLANQFFKELFKSVQEPEIQDVNCVVMGAPGSDYSLSNVANDYSHVVLDLILSNINKEIFKGRLAEKNLRVRPEPSLAGMAFFSKYPKLDQGRDNTLIIDIGGGTTDLSLICRADNGEKIFTPITPCGNLTPAGNEIDTMIEDGIKRLYGLDSNVKFYHENIMKAKEDLFLSPRSKKISSLADLNNNLDIFDDYHGHGRRTVVKDMGNNRYLIVFNNEHRKGIPNDGFNGENWDGKVYCLTDDLYANGNDNSNMGPCAKLAQKVKEYVGDSKGKYPFNRVLFVGGTSQMYPVRDYIIKVGLNLAKKEDGEYYRDNGIEKVSVYSLDTYAANNDTTEYYLTYANMVAIGAAYAAEEDNDGLHSIPELYVKVKGPEFDRRLLLSQDLKNGKYNKDELKWPYGINIPNGITKVQFQIIEKLADGREKIFPQKGYFSFSVPVDYPVRKDDDAHPLLFLADYSEAGVVALFACLLDKPNISRVRNAGYIVDSYDFKITAGMQDRSKGIFNNRLNSYVNGIYGTIEGCKCKKYSICTVIGANGSKSDKFVGKRYSICSNVGKDGFGWKTKGGNRYE